MHGAAACRPRGKHFFYSARVMEKPSLLSPMLLLDLLERLPLRATDTMELCRWMGRGSQFMAYELYSLSCLDSPERFGIDSAPTAGPESHTKGVPDGMHAGLTRIKRAAGPSAKFWTYPMLPARRPRRTQVSVIASRVRAHVLALMSPQTNSSADDNGRP